MAFINLHYVHVVSFENKVDFKLFPWRQRINKIMAETCVSNDLT